MSVITKHDENTENDTTAVVIFIHQHLLPRQRRLRRRANAINPASTYEHIANMNRPYFTYPVSGITYSSRSTDDEQTQCCLNQIPNNMNRPSFTYQVSRMRYQVVVIRYQVSRITYSSVVMVPLIHQKVYQV